MFEYGLFTISLAILITFVSGINRVSLDEFDKELQRQDLLRESPRVEALQVGVPGSRRYVDKSEFDRNLKEINSANGSIPAVLKQARYDAKINDVLRAKDNQGKPKEGSKSRESDSFLVADPPKTTKVTDSPRPATKGTHGFESGFVPPIYPKIKQAYRRKMERLKKQQIAFLTRRQTHPNYTQSKRSFYLRQGTDTGNVQTGGGDGGDGKDGGDSGFLNPYSILEQIQSIAKDFSDVNITTEVLGRTTEYKQIVLMKAVGTTNSSVRFRTETGKFTDEGPAKSTIFIVHGLAVTGFIELPCLYKISQFKELLRMYFAHLDKFDFFIIPMANPDGVSTSKTKSRWNKNMSSQHACPGVAVDRNFDVAWNESGALSSCSQQYPGPTPFSEVESQAVRDVFHKHSHRISAFIHLHAGMADNTVFKGDAILYPKGYSESSSDDDKYVDLRGEVDEVLKNASFKVYSVAVDSIYNWYGKVAGTSVDYASSIYGVPFCVEIVMQLYSEDPTIQNSDEREQGLVLKEVWRRVLDVMFKGIHKQKTHGERSEENNK